LPLAVWAVVLAAQGVLGAAVRAVIVYPQAYAAEIASRMPLGPALGRGVERFVRGVPLLVLSAAAGVVLAPRDGSTRVALAWLVLAATGVAVQRQMASYHLVLLLPALVWLAATGLARLAHRLPELWRHALHGPRRLIALAACVLLAGVTTFAGVNEARLWQRQYAPHVAFRSGRTDDAGFLQALGGPGPAWAEAQAIVADMRCEAHDALFVWGLAPALYAQTGCAPASRWVFHQTFLVEDSPLSRRWPDAAARRAELLQRFETDPPRWIVVVAGDRSGLEPVDSRAELQHFPRIRVLARDAHGAPRRDDTLRAPRIGRCPG
jgi:hypothetical protein